MTAVSLLNPVSSLIDAKLGRCVRCMRLSAGLTAGSWLLFAALSMLSAQSWMTLTVTIATVLSTSVSLAHAVAYAVREPAPVTGCSACAQKAKTRARIARRRRRMQWLRHPLTAFRLPRRTRTARPCGACKQKITAENMLELADQLPAAEVALRAVVESSVEYQLIASRLVSPEPVDTWQADMRNHFLYRLRPDENGQSANALFVARWEDYALMSAVLITPNPTGEPTIVDLRA